MADLSKVRLNGTVYNFKDAEARLLIETLPLATTSTNGLMSATDKQVIDNLNPNVTINITDWYNSDLDIINFVFQLCGISDTCLYPSTINKESSSLFFFCFKDITVLIISLLLLVIIIILIFYKL